ncbi:MAG: family 16 glycosylhydrolase [Bacteroidales bacterium]|nr:family 16 glycosylhydrolase [Bacteroidales bacterium]
MSAKFSLYAKFGMIPKTSVLEEKKNKLKQEFEDFNAYTASEELARYKELDAFVTSKEFEDIKKEINAKKYPGSEPFEKEKSYKAQKKSKRIKTYYQVKDSQELKDYESFKNSEKLAGYEELYQFFTSPEFDEFKKSLIQQKQEKTQEIKEKQAKYKELKKKFKWFFALKDSKQLSDFIEFSNSQELQNYIDLEKEITAIDFDALKNEIENQKKEKIEELNSIITRHKELKVQYSKYKKAENFPEKGELDEITLKIKSGELKKAIKDFKLENLDEYKKLKEYESLKKTPLIKKYLNTENKSEISPEIQNKISSFLEIEKYIKSLDFNEIKSTFELQKKEKEEEYSNLLSRLQELKKIKEGIKKGIGFTKNDEIEELEATIKSGEHKKAIKELKFENLDEFKKLKEFEKLKKSSKIKNYFKFKDSDKYKNYLQLDGSEEIESFLELEKEINSPEFKSHIDEIKNLKFENTEEFKKQKEYKLLKKSAEIKQYFKFKDSEKLAIYTELNGSQEIVDYEELEAYINSEEFKEEKKYLLTKDKFKLSEEFKQAEEFKELKNSEKIKWYLKLEKQNDFDKLHEWELTFEDNFDGNKLDTEKWMTGYYWGKNLLNDDYVQMNEKQFFKEDNLELNNSNLRIITKQENVQGKVWDPSMGFYPKDFEYTSGLVNTGQYFRQQHGLFTAKIKVDHSYPVHHAFWLLGEKITPEIDIFKYGKKSSSKLEVANYWNGDGNIKKNKKSLGGVNFAKDYFIYSLEWTKDKLTWKINDVVLHEQTTGIPDEPMYIVLSSGISQEGNPAVPCNMEIDWVKAFKKSE